MARTIAFELGALPYFDVNAQGNVAVRLQPNGRPADLYEFVQSLVKSGIEAPILIRFDDILKDRIYCIQRAFDAAINEFRYENTFRLAYPIKVNQQKTIVDLIKKTGSDRLLGLEVGSKPELIAVLSIHDTPDALLLCNGYKDAEYIEIALLATKVGRRSIIIIEQLYELQIVLDIAKKLNIEAEIGFRMRPFNKGSGRWSTSGGDMAKFGLSVHEIVLGLEMLKAAGKLGWVKLLHFHLGSQIPAIASIKKVLSEAARMYTELAKECPGIDFFDVGGGLGVDYDGSKMSTDSSMDYSIEEYARDVVSAIGDACEKEELPVPTIIAESGRATVAHHSVLITEVIDVAPTLDAVDKLDPPPSDNEVLTGLYDSTKPSLPTIAMKSSTMPKNSKNTSSNASSMATFHSKNVHTPNKRTAASSQRFGMSRNGFKISPKNLKTSTNTYWTPTSATSPSSNRSRTSGPSTNFSLSCRSTGSMKSRRAKGSSAT